MVTGARFGGPLVSFGRTAPRLLLIGYSKSRPG